MPRSPYETGFGMLKVWFSPSGDILPAYELLPFDDLDYEFVEWARREIAGHQSANALILVLDPKGDRKEDGYWRNPR
jgi:hypothetical protein